MMRVSRLFLLGFAAVVAAQSRPSVISTANSFDYIVSVPDVHGDLHILLRSLWLARNHISGKSSSFSDFVQQVQQEQVSPSNSSISSRILLVQTGDIVDRGPFSRSCYEALWAAEKVLGWKLVNLFGNHEVMTMAGQADHYAHAGDVKEFGSLKSRQAEFAPGGKIWKKLTQEYLVMLKVKIGNGDDNKENVDPNIGGVSENILFVHAGINVEYVEKLLRSKNPTQALPQSDALVEKLNEVLIAEIMRKPGSELLTHPESPIWTRQLANANERVACNSLFPKIKSLFQISRMVVGHTPQETLVTGNRCNGTLILADVAMSRWMGSGEKGNPAVLVFELAKNGTLLRSVKTLYWKGSVQGDEGTVKSAVIWGSGEQEQDEAWNEL